MVDDGRSRKCAAIFSSPLGYVCRLSEEHQGDYKWWNKKGEIKQWRDSKAEGW